MQGKKFSRSRTSRSPAQHALRSLSLVVLIVGGSFAFTGSAFAASNNLVTNSSFSGGNVGFTTQYTYSPTGLGGTGQYAVGNSPNTLNGAWPALKPHDSTEMFIANGASSPGTQVWSETIPVSADSPYVVSLWAASLYSVPAVFDIYVNGASIGTRSAPAVVGVWNQIRITWNSGSATTAKLVIVDTDLSSGGNDFALDDIALSGDVANGVAPIASTLGTPWEIFHSVSHDVIGGGITMAVLLFIAFPANIFNQTFSDHYSEIMLTLNRVRRRLRHPFKRSRADALPSNSTAIAAPANTAPGRVNREWFGATLVAGALLGGLLNPKFGLNLRSLEALIATLIAFGVGAIVSWFIARTFRRLHKYPSHTYLRALPMGLLIAAGCVAISRLSHFEPGYLYGVVVSISFIESMDDRHSVHLIAISTLSTLAVAVLAWFAWIPVNHVATGSTSNLIEVIADDALASIFVGGLMGTVIGLIPLEGLPGGHLSKWRKDVWGVIFFIALFLLIEVELNPNSGPTHPGGAPVLTAIVLFVVFGALSIGLHQYFARRGETKEEVSLGPTASSNVESAE